MSARTTRFGFTLVEGLIALAIVLTLAAVIGQSYTEARTRKNLSRVKYNMQKAAVAVESFRVDRGFYPADGIIGSASNYDTTGQFRATFNSRYAKDWGLRDQNDVMQRGLNLWLLSNQIFLTSPVAYLNPIPRDPFGEENPFFRGTFLWCNFDDRNAFFYGGSKFQVDPYEGASNIDGKTRPLWFIESAGPDGTINSQADPSKSLTPYDPTNGTISYGDIFRAGPL